MFCIHRPRWERAGKGGVKGLARWWVFRVYCPEGGGSLGSQKGLGPRRAYQTPVRPLLLPWRMRREHFKIRGNNIKSQIRQVTVPLAIADAGDTRRGRGQVSAAVSAVSAGKRRGLRRTGRCKSRSHSKFQIPQHTPLAPALHLRFQPSLLPQRISTLS